jgi:C4-dicarboxylate transporter, DcuC family
MGPIQWASLVVIAMAVIAILRGWDVRLVLFIAAFTLGTFSRDPSSIIRVFFETFSAEKFVVPICCAMGFAYILRHTRCDQQLVRMLIKPVEKVRFLLIPGVIFVAFTVNIPVISQTSVAVCVGPVVIPLMRAAGFGPATIAACLCLGASIGGELLNPGAPELLTVSAKTGATPTTLSRQFLPPLLIPYVLVATLTFWAQTFWWGDSTTAASDVNAAGEAKPTEPLNFLKAVVPLVPLLLLFLTGPPLSLIEIPEARLAANKDSFGSRLIGVAMLVGVFVALVVSPRHAKDGAKVFFEGAGYGFTTIISLIVTGACFAEGLKLCGLAAALGKFIGEVPQLLVPLAALVPWAFAIISGSGMASTKGLYEFFYGPAMEIGHEPNEIGAVVSVASAAGRTMSPVAAVVLMCATLNNVKPFDIVKRLAGPLLLGLVVTVVLRMMRWV